MCYWKLSFCCCTFSHLCIRRVMFPLVLRSQNCSKFKTKLSFNLNLGLHVGHTNPFESPAWRPQVPSPSHPPLMYLCACDGISQRRVHPPSLPRTAIPGAAASDANQSFYSERDNLWLARRVTDSISGMFLLSCPMFGAVISLHQAACSAAATPISRVAIYPTSNWIWQAACKQRRR